MNILNIYNDPIVDDIPDQELFDGYLEFINETCGNSKQFEYCSRCYDFVVPARVIRHISIERAKLHANDEEILRGAIVSEALDLHGIESPDIPMDAVQIDISHMGRGRYLLRVVVITDTLMITSGVPGFPRGSNIDHGQVFLSERDAEDPYTRRWARCMAIEQAARQVHKEKFHQTPQDPSSGIQQFAREFAERTGVNVQLVGATISERSTDDDDDNGNVH